MSRKLKDLSLKIFTFFFEEYFKDRLFDAIEMESVLLLKSVLNISCKDFYTVMRSTDEKYQCGEIKYEMSMTAIDCIKCLGRTLKKVFASKDITEEEEKLILKITDAFDISETMFKGFIENFEIQIKLVDNNSDASDKVAKNKEVEILEDIFGDSGFDSENSEPSGKSDENYVDEIFSSESVVEQKVEETVETEVKVVEEEVYKINSTPGKRKKREKKIEVTQSVSEEIANSNSDVESLMKIVGNKKTEKKTDKKKSSPGVMDLFSAMVQDKESTNNEPEKVADEKYEPEVKKTVESVPDTKKDNTDVDVEVSENEVIENSPFSIKGMKMLRRGVPEFRIAMNVDVLDSIFIDEFLNWSSNIYIYYYCDSAGSWFIAADLSGKKILARHKLNDIEKEDFLSIFSPGISNHYSICLMSGNQKIYFLCNGEIDITGKHFSGLRMINSGNESEGITELKAVAGNNERVFGLCNRIGEYYLLKSQLAPALIFFFKENEHFPHNAICSLHLVEVFKKRSKLVRAKDYLEKASLLDPFRFEYLMEDLSNLLVNFEKNTDMILNHLMVCIILWEDNELYLPVLKTVSEKTGLDDLSPILAAKCQVINKPINDFYKIVKKFEAGLFDLAVADCKSFFNNHKSFYNQNVEFRKIIEKYFETVVKSIPDKEISDSIHSILLSV